MTTMIRKRQLWGVLRRRKWSLQHHCRKWVSNVKLYWVISYYIIIVGSKCQIILRWVKYLLIWYDMIINHCGKWVSTYIKLYWDEWNINLNQASLWEVSHAFDLRASNVNLYWISCNFYEFSYVKMAQMLGIFFLTIMISPESGRIYHQAIVSKKLCGDSRYLTGVSKNIAAQHRDPDAKIKVCLI